MIASGLEARMQTLARNQDGAWIAESTAEGNALRFYFTRPAPFAAQVKASLIGACAGALVFAGLFAISWLLPLGTLRDMFGAQTIARTMQALWIGGLPATFFVSRERWLSRRYGSCLLGPEGFHRTDGTLSIPLDRVLGSRRTEAGVLVRRTGSAMALAFSPEVLVPADTPEEFELATSLLKGVAPSSGSYVLETQRADEPRA